MRVEFYKGADKDWRWRAVAKNNRNMANSGEGYENKQDCMDAAQDVLGMYYETIDTADGTLEVMRPFTERPIVPVKWILEEEAEKPQ